MKIVFATNNKHKLEEVRQITAALPIEIVSLAEISCHDDIPETADTLEGNALQKAHYIKEKFGLDCFADDTGLEVEALNNAPGVYSARYAGEAHDSEANMKKLLTEMEGQTNRNARFRTVIALISGDDVKEFEGTIDGAIIKERRGTWGFGYDKIFVPDGYDSTFANSAQHYSQDIGKQIEKGRAFIRCRYGESAYSIYFQSFTNTYGTVDHLKAVYDEALSYGPFK